MSCSKGTAINIYQLFAAFLELTITISHGWAPSVLIETCDGVPCAFTSSADVSTMLFKLKGWPGRHSSLSQSVAVIELETWRNLNPAGPAGGSESLSQSESDLEHSLSQKACRAAAIFEVSWFSALQVIYGALSYTWYTYRARPVRLPNLKSLFAIIHLLQPASCKFYKLWSTRNHRQGLYGKR